MIESSQARRKVPHRQKAEQLGVSTRTLDRWIEDRIIAAPDVVNGRKYHNVDSEPRRDGPKAA
jgi:hypothetical protein